MALVAILTAVGRDAFTGSRPLIVFNGNLPGCGKSLLADIVSWIAQGKAAPRMTQVRSEELQKRLSGLMLANKVIGLFDNLSQRFGGAPLDAILTGEVWETRMLGTLEHREFPISILLMATGNDVTFSGDLERRVLVCDLMSPEENPETRQGFTIPDLKGHILHRRKSLYTDAMSILAAYLRRAVEVPSLRPIGSFEGWSDTVRSALVWAGGADPVETQENRRPLLRFERDQIDSILKQILQFMGSHTLTTRGLYDRCTPPMVHSESSGATLLKTLSQWVDDEISPPTLGILFSRWSKDHKGRYSIHNANQRSQSGYKWRITTPEELGGQGKP